MRVSKVTDPDKIIDYLVAGKKYRANSQALVLGIRDYFGKMGFTKAILVISGGIDSAVTLALACEALGKENVQGSTDAFAIFNVAFCKRCRTTQQKPRKSVRYHSHKRYL